MAYRWCTRGRIDAIGQARAWMVVEALARDLDGAIAIPAVQQDIELVRALVEARERVSAVAATLERRADP